MSHRPSQSYYASHGPMSDPGTHGASIDDLPRDIAALCTVIQGFLIHDAGLGSFQDSIPEFTIFFR